MEVNKASFTAIVSAFGRAYHWLNDEPKIFNDYLAEKMITNEEFKNISKNMIEGIKFFNPEDEDIYKNEESMLKWIV